MIENQKPERLLWVKDSGTVLSSLSLLSAFAVQWQNPSGEINHFARLAVALSGTICSPWGWTSLCGSLPKELSAVTQHTQIGPREL